MQLRITTCNKNSWRKYFLIRMMCPSNKRLIQLESSKKAIICEMQVQAPHWKSELWYGILGTSLDAGGWSWGPKDWQYFSSESSRKVGCLVKLVSLVLPLQVALLLVCRGQGCVTDAHPLLNSPLKLFFAYAHQICPMEYWPRDVSVRQTAGRSSVLPGRNPWYKAHCWLDVSGRKRGRLLGFSGGGGGVGELSNSPEVL